MPQVRHKALTATTEVVSDARAAELVAAGTHVLVDLPAVDKGTPQPSKARVRKKKAT